MRIGIDARKLNRELRTGIEEYSYHVVRNLLKIEGVDEYILYFDQPPTTIANTALGSRQARQIVLPFPRQPLLWANIALPSHLFRLRDPLDVLFMPVNYIPVECPCKIVFTAHDVDFGHFSRMKRFAQSVLVRHAARFADRIIAVSKNTREDLVQQFGIEAEKIEVVYHAYDEKIFHTEYSTAETEALRSRYVLREPPLVYCGTFQPRKNVPRLIRAYSVLVKRFNLRNKLVLVGKLGWSYGGIFEAIEDLGLQERVVVTGYLPAREIALLLNMAAAFVFPSLYEGFGIPLLEAMGCGAPVVTSNVSSMPEIVQDAALLVDPYDVNEIADSMARVVFDTNIRERLIMRGRDRVKHFSWEKSARETLGVLENALRNG